MDPKRLVHILAVRWCEIDKETDPIFSKALDEVMSYVERFVPKKVIRQGQWAPDICPACGCELSKHYGDGYYSHDEGMDYCPNDECHQKLDWD